MADRVYTTDERPRDTVVVERDSDAPARHSNTGVVIALVIVGLILLFLLLGRFFGGSSGGGGVTPNINVQTPTPNQ
jgi:hypothetical protein